MPQTAAQNRTFALVVGVEKYGLGPGWDLFGPAGAACRFADWLLGRGVKPEHIFLFLSPRQRAGGGEPEPRIDPRLTARSADENLVHDFIVEDLARRDGDLLFFYWAGHGVIGDAGGGSRRLFFADATPAHKRNLDLQALLQFMRTGAFQTRQQVCVVDACANRVGDEGVASRGFPSGRELTAGRQQFVLLAAQPGQYARNLPADRSCLFTTELLALLNTDAVPTWPPCLEGVAQALRDRFGQLRRTGLAQQAPTFISFRGWDGEETSVGSALDGGRAVARGQTGPDAGERRARADYLKAVREDCERRRRASLHHAVLELSSEKTDRTTHLPWLHVDLAEGGRRYDRVEDAFAEHSRRLLILGEPGSGKSTSALQLAVLLLEEAEKDPSAPVPLVVNLSGYRPRRVTGGWWGRRTSRDGDDPARPAVADGDVERWLAEQMRPYGWLPLDEARRWLAAGRVAVFFDGLDEVEQEFRGELAQLLNATYLADHPGSVAVVCSRVDEYRALRDSVSTRLALRGGVTLKPLDDDRVRTYLREAGAEALADRLLGDEGLQELARTPLTLSMLALAYGGLPPESLPTGGTLSDRRRLMDEFVRRMLQRKERRDRGRPFVEGGTDDVPEGEYQYPPEVVNRYLGWLAVQLSVRMRTAFPPDRCYPLVAEKPSAREGLRSDPAASAGVWAGWSVLALVIAAAGTFPLIPVTPGGGLLAGAIFLGAVAGGGVVRHVLSMVGNEGGVYMVAALPIALVGVGLLGHSTAAVLPWGWSPYPCTLISLFLLIGVVSGVAILNPKERLQSAVMVSAVGLTVPVSLALAAIVGWPFSFDRTWAGCLVTAWGCAAFVVGWRHPPSGGKRSWHRLVGGASIGCFALLPAYLCLAAAWITDPPAWYLAVAAFTLTVFLFAARREGELLILPVGFAPVISLGGLAGGVVGSTLGAWVALCLLAVVSALRSQHDGGDQGRNRVVARAGARLSLLAERFCLEPVVRVVLAAAGRRPLRWRRFRLYVQDALLIKRAGPDREFAHRLLRDYFATRELATDLADGGRRAEALRKLGFQGESAIETLAEYLGHPDPETQQAAAEGLGRIQSLRVWDLLNGAAHSPNPAVRRGVVLATRFRDETEQAVMSGVLGNEEDISVILAWVSCFITEYTNGDKEWRDMFLFRFLAATKCDPRVVEATLAYAALASFKLPIRPAQPDMPVEREWERFRLLRDILQPDGWVARWLTHDRPNVRAGAVVVASTTGRLAVGQAGELLCHDTDATVRANAVLALGQFAIHQSGSDGPAVASQKVVSHLRMGLRDSDSGVRVAAAYTATSLNVPERRVIMVGVLRDPDLAVRRAAVWGLAARGDSDSLFLLWQALEDPDPTVRRSVVEALLGLATGTGRTWPGIPRPNASLSADSPDALDWAKGVLGSLEQRR